MALFDSYFDPQQFGSDGGGLLSRLMAVAQQQGQYQPGAGFGPQSTAGDGPASSVPQTPVPLPMPRPVIPNSGPASLNPQTPDYGQTQNIPIGDYRMPQFGRADILRGAQPPPDFGDRLGAGFQSWAHTPVGNPIAALANGIAGLSTGQRTDAPGVTPSQGQAPAGSPDFGDRLGAGFQSWAHTPVGNPIAALANGIAGLSTGQRTDGPGVTPSQGQAPQVRPILAIA